MNFQKYIDKYNKVDQILEIDKNLQNVVTTTPKQT
jgi:hypothetical protein